MSNKQNINSHPKPPIPSHKNNRDSITSITSRTSNSESALTIVYPILANSDHGNHKEDADSSTLNPTNIRNRSVSSWDSAITYNTMNSTRSSVQYTSDDGSSSLLWDEARKSAIDLLKADNSRSEHATLEFTINKLDIKSLGIIGRERELRLLNAAFQRLTGCYDDSFPQASSRSFNSGSENEIVFISGPAGIGKSTLAQSLKKKAITTNVAFAEGKYEFTSIHEPYSGVAQAFGELCNKFKDYPAEIVADLSQTIHKTMREEFKMLSGLIPELGTFFEDDEQGDPSSHSRLPIHSTGKEHERWKYAFRILTRILGSHFSALVIVLDDLQWADTSSLDILDHLISDIQNPQPLMIIGCYRSNEVDDNSILYNRMQTLQAKSEKFGFKITDINLQNFDVDSVNTMIMAMLSIDDESKTRDLAEVCFKRTLGNPFFLIEFMKMLQAEGLLQFNLGILKWVWAVSRIEDATMSTANVVDLLQSRMRKLPADVQLLLQYAACLGSSFAVSTLRYVWKKHALLNLDGANPSVTRLLRIVQNEKLIEPCGSGEYRWVHDKVQEAALSLSDLVTHSFQFDLGICLYEGLPEPQLEKQLFDVADLVNKGIGWERPDLSKLNLRAAKKARKMAAFESGSRYVANGIKQLSFDSWVTNKELTLELYSLGAEMNMTLGKIAVVQSYIAAVLDREGQHTPMETVFIKMIKLEILNTVELCHDEAVNYGVKLLKEIGYSFVWRRRGLWGAQALALILKTARRLEKIPVDHFKTIGMMKDSKHLAIASMLSMLHVASHNGNDIFFNFLCVCKVIETTLDHGLHTYSAAGFASLAAVVIFLKNDSANASRFCDIAFLIQEKVGIRNAAETLHISWGFVLCYTKPLHEALNPTLDGYSKGLRDGDNGGAMLNLLLRFVYLPYIMGKNLGSIVEKFPTIAAQLEESGRTKELLALRACWQMILNLQLPPNEASKKLEGEVYSQSSETSQIPWKVANENLANGELLLFFSDHEARTKRLMNEEKGKTYSELIQGYFPSRIETFHRGIALFATARHTRRRKHMSEAMKVRKQIAKWAKTGDPNIQHYHLLLNAEVAVLEKRFTKADALYKQAICRAARIGHIHHAALFHERFAEYRLEVRGDKDDGKYHMEQAVRYYTEWGAVGKAEELKKVVKNL
ncbi:unnamed protein product [Cylindrotheca closterium]|uniref:Orc1-like AAA ATPase domain-containing protein n=1 Tax=Cylindrotheca closterium TaxID=2856 RepID=A0AAD2G3I7_9STRA|nr:unnamed protein product [Cylindrotheca closterium]